MNVFIFISFARIFTRIEFKKIREP